MAEHETVKDKCEFHYGLEDTVRKSVPRWVFTTAMSVMVVLSLSFGGWHSSQMTNLKETLDVDLDNMETRIDLRMQALKEKYSDDVGRFYRVAERNGDKLDRVVDIQNNINVTMQDFKTKQDMVLRKIDLSNGDGTHP